MNYMEMAVLLPYIAGIVGLLFLKKLRKVSWGLFVIVAIYQLFLVVKLYGLKPYTENLGFVLSIFNSGKIEPIFIRTNVGYIFFAGSTIVTVLIALFSFSFNDKKHSTAVAPTWIILMGANAGIFFAGDWITFLFSWEVMGWTSYFIIAQGKRNSARASLYYYVLSLIGTSGLLAGIFALYRNTGSMIIADNIKYLGSIWSTNPGFVYFVIIAFTITFFAKSSVYPFYMWPAKAHAEAPDDFSSFLSGIMIKYGVFGLVAIILPVFKNYTGVMVRGLPLYLAIMAWMGAITAVWGTLYAIIQNDMKRLMAYSTVANIGYIVTAISLNTSLGIAAGLFHTFNHMVFKGGIFLTLAAVKYRTGEREMHRLGGLAYRMPLTFFTFLISIIAAAGIPPMSGFSSKWLTYQAIFGKKYLILSIPIFFASTGAFMYLYRGLHSIFLGQLSTRFNNVKEAPFLMSLSMLLILMFVFLVGVFPGLVLTPINKSLVDFGMEKINQDLIHIKGVTTGVNFLLIAMMFMSGFVLTMILYSIGKSRRHVEALDNYTAGEDPEEWGMTVEDYHYAKKFYEPVEVEIEPFLKKTSCDRFFQKIAYEAERLGGNLKRWFNSPQLGTVVILVVLLLVLVIAIPGLM